MSVAWVQNGAMTDDSTAATARTRPRVAEFFAGIGLVRAGLEDAGFDIVWANDIAPFKQEMYDQNFAGPEGQTSHFRLGDIAEVGGDDIPDIDLAWASFPCTDLSLAGGRSGLNGSGSGTFFHFTRVLREMGPRRPAVIAVENVVGLATSRGGDDIIVAVKELNRLGYSVDVMAVDARRFVPQSRPRLFLVGEMNPHADGSPDEVIRPDLLETVYSVGGLRMHKAPTASLPPMLSHGFSSLIEAMWDGDGRWWSEERLAKFTTTLSPVQARRVTQLQNASSVTYRTAYRRTRNGVPVWEVRPDDISGCLRTARGGSSKQAVLKLGRGHVQVRWMTPLEYARLMGAGEYNLSGLRDSQVLFGFGDAVCAPAVSWLGRNYLQRAVSRVSARSSAVLPEARSA